ncbi:MAG TPA: DUF2079 domain-containing protein [Candidatus Saccharimonadales bacterium]|nr:DUF2079 domain-containing protein [Candidatus Saccharimonadales bacterium]
MKSQLYSLMKFIIGLPLTLLALFFIIKTILSQAPQLLYNLHSVHVFLLIYGIISFIIFYFVRSYLWYRILRYQNYTITFRESCYLWSVSELKRYIPGNVWSFLGRTILFQKKGIQKKDIAKGLVVEAELFVLGSAIVSLLALPFYFSGYQTVEKWVIEIVVLIVTVGYCYNKKFVSLFKGKLLKIFSFLVPPFSFEQNTFLVWLSVIALFFFGIGNYLTIASVVYLNPRLFLDLIGIFDFAFVVGYLSVVTPAGFGVREGIVIVSLSKITTAGLAAFGALFSRIILIISELFFILLNTLWFKTNTKTMQSIEKAITTYPQVMLVILLSSLYMLYFTIVSFLRYDNFYTGRFDLGNMAQTVWNSLHGRIFILTNPNGTEQISRLAFHADFILVLLAPIYALWQDPKMLLLIQTFVAASGAFFVYIIVRDILKDRTIALVFSFIYLLNPGVERANIFDFHAVTLVTTFFFAAYYFFMKKKYVWFIVFAFLAALCKEQIWVIIALFGLMVFFFHKKRILGASIFIFSLGVFYYLFWVAIPHAYGSQHFALAYLSDYGANPTQIVKGIFLSPAKTITTIFEPTRLAYLNDLFMPVGYLALLFPFFLIFAGPDLLIDLLSNNAQLHEIYYQYTATITPFVFLSAIYGIAWLRKTKLWSLHMSTNRWNFFFIVYLLSFGLFTTYKMGPLPGAVDPNLDMFTRQLPDRAYVDTFLSQIPKDESVAASNDIGSHLSLRQTIYTVPYGLDRADVIALLITDTQTKEAYLKVSKDKHYREVAQKDDFVAFKRL